MTSPDTLPTAARTALACLDLTSLNDATGEADVAKLCERAQGPQGSVAAVCVWPRFAAFARARLPAHIGVAAVANFPDGSADVARAVRDASEIVQAGAQEVDVVLPFAALMAGDASAAATLLQAVRRACDGLTLKVILETGVLADAALIATASRIALDAGADFLKTSTGKTPISATPQAARVMLQAIAQASPPTSGRVGFKASGGIRTVADAAVYIALCAELLGLQAAAPARFRIGASSLLNDIEAVLGGQGAGTSGAPGSY
ncbi:MAG: deoxyribose-phosphate aldolase [Methylibium sp. NZG]|nr:MAG: deoxyribose-phosphate aldolase [Methylibium sp. NZG]